MSQGATTHKPADQAEGTEAVRHSYDTVAGRYAAEIGEELAAKPLDRALLDAFAETCAAVQARRGPGRPPAPYGHPRHGRDGRGDLRRCCRQHPRCWLHGYGSLRATNAFGWAGGSDHSLKWTIAFMGRGLRRATGCDGAGE